MSKAAASFTETVYVRLLDEAVEVWRPVSAARLSNAVFELAPTPEPADETWAFKPGEVVVAEPPGEAGRLTAFARAADLDRAAPALRRLAG